MKWLLVAQLMAGVSTMPTTEEACKEIVNRVTSGYEVKALFSDGKEYEIIMATCVPLPGDCTEESASEPRSFAPSSFGRPSPVPRLLNSVSK